MEFRGVYRGKTNMKHKPFHSYLFIVRKVQLKHATRIKDVDAVILSEYVILCGVDDTDSTRIEAIL